MPRSPSRPLTEQDGQDFVAAIAEAHAKGYVLWHLTEQWNGRWHARVADPNSNDASGSSVGRDGDSPAEAIRNCIRQFAPTEQERLVERARSELRDADILRAPVAVKDDMMIRLLRAFEDNARARRS